MIIRPPHEKGWKNYLFGKAWANIAWFFMGGICGTSVLTLKLDNILWAGLITMGLITGKESLDEITSYFEWCSSKLGLDPAGGDWRDILLGILGIGTAIIIIGKI